MVREERSIDDADISVGEEEEEEGEEKEKEDREEEREDDDGEEIEEDERDRAIAEGRGTGEWEGVIDALITAAVILLIASPGAPTKSGILPKKRKINNRKK